MADTTTRNTLRSLQNGTLGPVELAALITPLVETLGREGLEALFANVSQGTRRVAQTVAVQSCVSPAEARSCEQQAKALNSSLCRALAARVFQS